MRGGRCHISPTFSWPANLHYIDSDSQRCNTDKTRGKSSVSANWAQGKSFLSVICGCPTHQQFPYLCP